MTDANTYYPPNNDNGSFVYGFAFGLMAGAVGYYLLGTKEGSKVRESLVTELSAAKQAVKTQIDQDVQRGKPIQVSIRKLVKEAVDQVVERAGLEEVAVEKKKSKVKADAKTETAAKKVTKKSESKKSAAK